jgi:hypothetical protein
MACVPPREPRGMEPGYQSIAQQFGRSSRELAELFIR